MDVGLANGAEEVIVKGREQRSNVRNSSITTTRVHAQLTTLSTNQHHVLHDHTR
jgi:hypothetical protein